MRKCRICLSDTKEHGPKNLKWDECTICDWVSETRTMTDNRGNKIETFQKIAKILEREKANGDFSSFGGFKVLLGRVDRLLDTMFFRNFSEDELTAKEKVKLKIDQLEAERVTQVYSGKPGCGCGCRGRYYDDAKNIKRVVRAMKKMSGQTESRLSFQCRVGIGSDCFSVETETRYYWAYV